MVRKQPKRTPRPGLDEYGRTPLHYAADRGDHALAGELIAAGADASLADDDGWTPLHFAVQAHSPPLVQLLLQAGAPVDPPDSNGNTPLWRAVMDSQGRGEVIQALRAAGADPHYVNAHGISPVSLARDIGNFDVRRFFADLSGSPTEQ